MLIGKFLSIKSFPHKVASLIIEERKFQTQKSPQRELRAFSSLSPGLSGITGDLFGGAGGI